MIEFLEIFLFGQGDVQMALGPAAVMIGGALLNVAGGLFGAGKAKKSRKSRCERESTTK